MQRGAMKHIKEQFGAAALMCCAWIVQAQQRHPYLDPSLPAEQRAADLAPENEVTRPRVIREQWVYVLPFTGFLLSPGFCLFWLRITCRQETGGKPVS
jgi:hypothetical protein